MSISNIILQHLSSLALSAGLAGDPSAAQMVDQLEAGSAGRGHIMQVCAGESCTKEQRAELRTIASDAQADVKELRKAIKATQRDLARTMGRGDADPEEVASMLAELQAMSDELTERRAAAHDATMAVINAESDEPTRKGKAKDKARGQGKPDEADRDRGKPDKADAKGKSDQADRDRGKPDKADAKGKPDKADAKGKSDKADRDRGKPDKADAKGKSKGPKPKKNR